MVEISPSNFVQHEIIGLDVLVERSTNRSMEGLRGRVVDESMKMIFIEDSKGRIKKIPKAGNVFVFCFESSGKRIRLRVRGDILVARPEDRTKKLMNIARKMTVRR